MNGGLRGRLPWAVVQLQFSDVEGSPDTDRFLRQLTGSGSGGGNLLDYWRDMSYGAITMEQSELFGPWRMRYSLANDAADPLRNGQAPRNAWCGEARRLLEENGVDLNRFHAIIAVVNAHVDGSSTGLDFAGSWAGTWGEAGWRFCRNCSAMALSSAGLASGRCPVGSGPHDYSASGEYALATDSAFPGEGGWRECLRCKVLVYAPDPLQPLGSCPAGGSHSVDAGRQLRLRNARLPWGDQSGWRRCSRCSSLVYMGDAPRTVPGCAAGGNHDVSISGRYGVHMPIRGFSMFFASHEVGHGFGLQHAGRRNDTNGYADIWDVMGGFGHQFASSYEISGPGLAAPNRLLLSWIPPDRVARVEVVPGINQRITLGPLDTLEGMLPVTVEAITGSTVYTVELRRKSGWDRGLSRDSAVLIHEMPSSYVAAQRDWRYCGRCHSMNFAGRLKCAGGGIHDVSRSEAYVLGLEGTAIGQPGWRWCSKCQALVLIVSVSPQPPCPYGGSHDLSGSGHYVVAREHERGAAGQKRWRFCHRCGVLAYDRLSGGRSGCAAGGAHDFLGSHRYVVPQRSPGQSGWRWCAKCQQLVFMGVGTGAGRCAGVPDGSLGHDFAPSQGYAMHPDRDPYEGQRGWNWCKKCNGIVFEAARGRCTAGGEHDLTSGGGYRIPFEPARSRGQSGWKFCFRCGGLVFSGAEAAPCPAGGGHDLSRSGNYVVADARESELKLVPFDGTRDDWRVGNSFRDDAARLAITVESASAQQAVILIQSTA